MSKSAAASSPRRQSTQSTRAAAAAGDNNGKTSEADETDSPRDAGDNNGKKKSERGDTTQRSGQTSPRKRSPNKIYRAPPTPEPETLYTMERSFTLDCIAVNSTSNDYAKAKPKLGQVIPPYNGQKDRSTRPYFAYKGVRRTLDMTEQPYPGTSMEGPVIDRFYESGAGYRYLSTRNRQGAGHSRETIDGHGQFMSGIQPVVGYNGRYGYRRNNPWLRIVPSPFGVATNSPIY